MKEMSWRDKLYILRQRIKTAFLWKNISKKPKNFWAFYLKEQALFFRQKNSVSVQFKPQYIGKMWEKDPVMHELQTGSILAYSQHVKIISERQLAFDDSAYYVYYEGDVYRCLRRLTPCITLYETTIDSVFGSYAYCYGNYYHDLVEFFFQVNRLIEIGESVPVLWMGIPRGWQKTLIDIFKKRGITFLNLPSRLSLVNANRMYVFPATESRIAAKPYNAKGPLFDNFANYGSFLKKRLLPNDCEKATRKILATRSKSVRRTPANNQAMEDLFRELGFEVLDFGSYTLNEQVQIADQAAVIAGLHGANLTNIMFMQKGGRVIELMPQKKIDDDAYKRLSFIFNLVYERILFLQNGSEIDITFLRQELAKLGLYGHTGLGRR